MRGIRLGVLCTLVVVTALSLAACGDSGEDTVVTPDNPKGLAEEAGLDGIHSGHVESLLAIGNRSRGETIHMRLIADFKGLGEESLPQFHVSLSSQGLLGGRTVDFNGSLILLPSEALFIYGRAYRERPYQPDNVTFKELRSKFEEAQEEGGEGDVTACRQAAEGVELSRLVRSFKSEGRRKDPDGTPVFLVSGDIDVPRLIDLLVHLAQDPACGAQMRALGLPSAPELEAARARLEGRVKEAQATLAVDKDGVLHDLAVHVEWKNLQGESLEIEFEYLLREANKPTEVFISPGGKPLDVLLHKFGSSQAAAIQAGGPEAVVGFLKGIAGGMTGQLPPPRP